jgi:hypothetical protein
MARGSIDVTVEIDGIKQLDRDLKRLHPAVQRELKGDLKDIAQGVAREAASRSGAHSFSYRGAATGRSASVRSTGQHGFVARFLEFGFHPRGGSTFVDLDTYYDQGVDLYLEGVDVLLEIDTSGESKHRTAASKQLRAQYQENKLTWAQVAGHYNGLCELAEEVRPI